MLKFVEIHLSDHAAGEYVVLQNQGVRSILLHEWAVCTESWRCAGAETAAARHVFDEDVAIPPYGRVVLFTRRGEAGWQRANDGRPTFVAYAGRDEPLWNGATTLHLLYVAASRPLRDTSIYQLAHER